jgi:NADPH:quinone reductase-like Zn-dependent oxidoreductase
MEALIFRETGEPSSVLKLAEIPTPPLALGEALVRVLLSPINPNFSKFSKPEMLGEFPRFSPLPAG